MQIAIDGCKKVFAVDVNDDIDRIRRQPCMKREKDYPAFMKWTQEVPITKNGKPRSQDDIKKEKNKIKRRIDNSIVCPMNWLQDCLDKIQGSSRDDIIETHLYLAEKPEGKPKATQMSKVRKLVEEYDQYAKRFMMMYHDDEDCDFTPLLVATEEFTEKIACIKFGKATIYRLVETSLGIEGKTHTNKIYRNATKYTRRMLNVLYKTNKTKFLECFKTVSHICDNTQKPQ